MRWVEAPVSQRALCSEVGGGEEVCGGVIVLRAVFLNLLILEMTADNATSPIPQMVLVVITEASDGELLASWNMAWNASF